MILDDKIEEFKKTKRGVAIISEDGNLSFKALTFEAHAPEILALLYQNGDDDFKKYLLMKLQYIKETEKYPATGEEALIAAANGNIVIVLDTDLYERINFGAIFLPNEMSQIHQELLLEFLQSIRSGSLKRTYITQRVSIGLSYGEITDPTYYPGLEGDEKSFPNLDELIDYFDIQKVKK